jgi:hypothetical protein
MSGAIPLHARPLGRALIIGSGACRPQPLGVMQRLGYECAEAEDPYAAMFELCNRPLVYRAVVLSLQSVYREELLLIASLRRRYPHLAVWLTQTDGRQAALAEAMRLGIDGLVDEEGLHPMAAPPQAVDVPAPAAPDPDDSSSLDDAERGVLNAPEGVLGEPVLTAEELRALLQEQPSMPPAGGDGE